MNTISSGHSTNDIRSMFAGYRPFGLEAGHLRRFDIAVGAVKITVRAVSYEQALTLIAAKLGRSQ